MTRGSSMKIRTVLLLALLPGFAASPALAQYATTYVWDVKRRLVMEISPDPDGSGSKRRSATRYVYDVHGNVVKVERGVTTVPTGADFTPLETTTHQYDAARRKLRTTTPSAVMDFTYDAAGRQVCVAERMNPAAYATPMPDACALGAEGAYGPDRITKETYDLAGQRLSTIEAFGTSDQRVYATYSFSPNGQQTTITDARGNRSTLEYDGLDRVVRLRFPMTMPGANASSTTDFERYEYDEAGNRIRLWKRGQDDTDQSTSIRYEYDALNRVTLEDLPGGATADVRTSYDLLGRVRTSRFGTSASPDIVVDYDKAGRMVSETTNGRTLSYMYDASGNRTRITWPDGFYAGYTYDAADRVSTISQSTGGLLATLVQDEFGRRTSLTRSNGAVTGYTYDSAGRLKSLAHDPAGAAFDQSWAYDLNPVSQITRSVDTNDAYRWSPAASQQVKTYDGLNRDAAIAAVTGGYDLRGNLTNDGVRQFAYDLHNRLLSVSGGQGLTLSYDPQGRLATTVSAGTTTRFLYDGPRLVAEYDGSGALLRRYVHGPRTDEPLVWIEEQGGTPQRRWLHHDRQGSVVAWSNAAGEIENGGLYSYGPWGEPSTWTGGRFRYTGQIMLPEAELYFFKARVYDPVAGRFLQTDPVGYKDDLNTYAYVGGDPLNQGDPTGQESANWAAYSGYTATGGKQSYDQWKADQYEACRNSPLICVGVAVSPGLAIGGIAAAEAAGIWILSNPYTANQLAIALGEMIVPGGGATYVGVAGSKIFASTDPLVGPAAAAIERAVPGAVQSMNAIFKRADGKMFTDADILLTRGIVQVKAGHPSGLLTQVQKSVALGKGPVFAYAPKMTSALEKQIRAAGGIPVRTEEELVRAVQEALR